MSPLDLDVFGSPSLGGVLPQRPVRVLSLAGQLSAAILHIDILQIAALTAVAATAARAASSMRHLFLVDSRVALCLAAKGRSASRALNTKLCKLVFRTRLSSADAICRNVVMQRSAPEWYRSVLEGDPAPFGCLQRSPLHRHGALPCGPGSW